jgi:DNA polymerase I-like protein with 3'-5' exonuclease and polymerase domains
MRKFYDTKTWSAFDVETSGDKQEYALQPWSAHGRVRSYAIAENINTHTDSERAIRSRPWAMHRENIIIDHPATIGLGYGHDNEVMANLTSYMGRMANSRHTHGVVGWNVVFDAAWLIHLGFREQVMEIKWLDAMQLWKHLTRVPESHVSFNRRRSYSLKACVAEYLPHLAGYDTDVDFDGPIEPLLKYNALDSKYTLRLAETMWNALLYNSAEQLRCALLESACIPLLADATINGININTKALRKLDVVIDGELLLKKHELAQEGVTPEIIASPVQLRKKLFVDWGLPVTRHTTKGAPSTDKAAMYDLAASDDRVRSIGRFRELQGLRTKFVGNILKSCAYNEEDVSHPTPNMNGTYTGRLTYSSSVGRNKEKRQTGFALHQMKRDPDYRCVIIPPKGFSLIELDAAGQEYRWMAIESGDETMLSLCEAGQDPHSYMGAGIDPTYTYQQLAKLAGEGDAEAKSIRQMGKVGNLSCQYRIGARSLLRTARVGHNMDINMGDAKRIHSTYHTSYPGVAKYWAERIHWAKSAGYAVTLAGRRVILDGDFNDPEDGWKLESTAVNFPIQGIGADQKYLALLALRNLLTSTSSRFAWELHDGIFIVAPTKKAKTIALQGQKILNNLPYFKAWGFHPPVPLPWDASVGPSWGELQVIKG